VLVRNPLMEAQRGSGEHFFRSTLVQTLF